MCIIWLKIVSFIKKNAGTCTFFFSLGMKRGLTPSSIDNFPLKRHEKHDKWRKFIGLPPQMEHCGMSGPSPICCNPSGPYTSSCWRMAHGFCMPSILGPVRHVQYVAEISGVSRKGKVSACLAIFYYPFSIFLHISVCSTCYVSESLIC